MITVRTFYFNNKLCIIITCLAAVAVTSLATNQQKWWFDENSLSLMAHTITAAHLKASLALRNFQQKGKNIFHQVPSSCNGTSTGNKGTQITHIYLQNLNILRH